MGCLFSSIKNNDGVPVGTIIQHYGGINIVQSNKSNNSNKSTNYNKSSFQNLVKINTELGNINCGENTFIGVYDDYKGYELKQVKHLDLVNDKLAFMETCFEYYYDCNYEYDCNYDNVYPINCYKFAWLFGYYHVCGYKLGEYIVFPIKNEMYSKKIIRYAHEFNFNNCKIKTINPRNSNSSIHKLEIKCDILLKILEQYKPTSRNLIIPDFIQLGDWYIRAGYLAGIYDASGLSTNHNIELGRSISEPWLQKIQQLYSSLGIAVSIKDARRFDEATSTAYWCMDLYDHHDNYKRWKTMVGKKTLEYEDYKFSYNWKSKKYIPINIIDIECRRELMEFIPIKKIILNDKGFIMR